MTSLYPVFNDASSLRGREEEEGPGCPFCAFAVPTTMERDMYTLMHHVETLHPENGQSPFVVRSRSISQRGSSRRGSRRPSTSPAPPPAPADSLRIPSSYNLAYRPRNVSAPGSQLPSRNRSRNVTPIRGEGHIRRSSATSIRSYRERTDRPRSSRGSSSEEERDEDVYVECPLHCGEIVHLGELPDHMDLHDAEGGSAVDPRRRPSRTPSPFSRPVGIRAASDQLPNSWPVSEDYGPESLALLRPPPPITRSSTDRSYVTNGESVRSRSREKARRNDYLGLRNFKELFMGPASTKTRHVVQKKRESQTVRRLGKAELGPHAYEAQMPGWLRQQLERGPRITYTNQLSPTGQIVKVEHVANETPGIIPVLAQLCEQDDAVSKVFLCHPSVKHIFKEPREGGFCGYRNIQMMISFIQGTHFPGYQHFTSRTPSILHLQDLIEDAWVAGFNSNCAVETGGIRGTRKYIGTPEAQALFAHLGFSIEATAFNKRNGFETVHENIFEHVLAYFSLGVTAATTSDLGRKVYQTGLAPIYFQHPGHSITVVGLEIRKSGSANLLVFDPMFKTQPGLCKLVGLDRVGRVGAGEAGKMLKAVRRGGAYLGKYNNFELLKLRAAPTPRFAPVGPAPPPLLLENGYVEQRGAYE